MRNISSLAVTILALAQLSTQAAEIGQWELFETSYPRWTLKDRV